MFEQAFKNIDDVLWKEAGCTTELDYTEQTSWLLFLKYLDALEQDKADEAALGRKPYTFILDRPYRWDTWAAPRNGGGQIDRNRAQTGDDLRDFVNQKLFPYLHGVPVTSIGNLHTAVLLSSNSSISSKIARSSTRLLRTRLPSRKALFPRWLRLLRT